MKSLIVLCCLIITLSAVSGCCGICWGGEIQGCGCSCQGAGAGCCWEEPNEAPEWALSKSTKNRSRYIQRVQEDSVFSKGSSDKQDQDLTPEQEEKLLKVITNVLNVTKRSSTMNLYQNLKGCTETCIAAAAACIAACWWCGGCCAPACYAAEKACENQCRLKDILI